MIPTDPFRAGTSTLDASTRCTAVGCSDQFQAAVNVDSTMVPAGQHTVEVTVNGATTACSFTIPPDPTFDNPPCSAGFALTVAPAQNCTTHQTDTVTSEQCQPIDGKFVETIRIDGTPDLVEVQQTVAGSVIFDQSVSPSYQGNQPNGPNCAPTCQQASVTWTIPQ